VAWGLTNLEADVQDLYLEETDPADRGRYFHVGGWHRFDVRSETIRVRGASDVALEIRSSVHGPIVTDVLRGAAMLSSPAVALRWTGLDPDDTTSEAFAGFNTAGDWRESLAAASRLKGPPQNIVYADVGGHIGYTASGSVPIRPRTDGLLPVSGKGDEDWAGYVPFERLPRVLDPPRGYVVTANNRVVSDSYPYALTRDCPEPYRARRITDRILSRALWSPEDARAIQLDQLSLQAEELLPLLLDTKPADTTSARALGLLKGWDREFGPGSVPASIYAAWYAKLSQMPQDELRDTPAGNVRSRFVINALKQDSRWCDDVRTPRTETCADLKAAALSEAVAALAARLGTEPSAWRWRRLHRARVAHGVFESVPLLRGFFSLEAGVGGDASTVNVGAYRRDACFLMTDGASYRQILDLADLSRGSYVHTTGQSGNVFDRHYRDLIALWRDGRYITLDNPPIKTLRLKPAAPR
jgi:penicillin amidase